MASVCLENVKKVYEGGAIAVHNINFEVKNKEFVVLVGPSGCGKSTTLITKLTLLTVLLTEYALDYAAIIC